MAVEEQSTARSVTVFGGSGFVGSAIVRRLAEAGHVVRIAVRHPDRARPGEGLEAVRADVWDAATVAPALDGVDAVVNTVGHYVEQGGATFDAIHGQGARNVALAARQCGVRRLVHISGLGADAGSASAYVRARFTGERLVREAFPDATILRPSVIFGPGDAFFNRLASLARTLPAMPLFGDGSVRLQPVFVGDVAAAVLQALSRPDAEGQTFELGGPGIFTYRELCRLVLEVMGRRRFLIPVPYAAFEVLARLPFSPVSQDQVTLMREDNVVSAHVPGLADLGVRASAVLDVLPTYLGR